MTGTGVRARHHIAYQPAVGLNAEHPIGGMMEDVVHGLGDRWHLAVLQRRYHSLLVLGIFAFVNGMVSIGIMAGAALSTHQPMLFPSLGASAFLLFYSPLVPAASPKNTIVAHLIGGAVGFVWLWALGLGMDAPALAMGFDGPRVLAVALSMGCTAGCMAWFKVPHPPAGATTLIVSLGLLTTPLDMVVLVVAVLALVGQAIVINRLAGIDYPLWAPHQPAPEPQRSLATSP